MSAKEKIKRAKKHIDELSAAVDVFIASNPFQAIPETEPTTGDLVVRLRVSNPIPAENWGCILGDILHNLRTALDITIAQLVEQNGQVVTQANAFPISKDKTTFDATVTRALSGIDAASVAEVIGLQPYKGGNDDFWHLHWLNISDKHRWLLLAGASNDAVIIDLPSFFPSTVGTGAIPPIALRPADRQFPLRDGSELYRIPSRALATHGSMPQFKFTIVYGDKEKVVWDKPLLPHMRKLLATVETALGILT